MKIAFISVLQGAETLGIRTRESPGFRLSTGVRGRWLALLPFGVSSYGSRALRDGPSYFLPAGAQ